MIPITIEPKVEGKGRSFSSQLVAYVSADALWEGGSGGDIRPAWAVIAGSDHELRPFLANWTRGRKAETGGGGRHANKYELLKSAGYAVDCQRFPEGSVATLYLPDLFRADPGMVDPHVVQFVMLPGRAWAEAQVIPERAEIAAYGESLDRDFYELPPEGMVDRAIPAAFLFAVYLDRRTRCPLVADGRFYLQLMASFLREGAAQRPGEGRWSTKAMGLEDAGIAETEALVVRVSHEDAEMLIARETKKFFEEV